MTLMELARQRGKAKVAVAARIGGVLRDLAAPVPSGENIEWVTIQDPVGIEIMRHSTAHVMAAAVKELFPDARITIGPAIENGFYYDFDVEKPFTPEDIERIEEKMGGFPGNRTRGRCWTRSRNPPFPSTAWGTSSTCAGDRISRAAGRWGHTS
jgi:hypothetical protein